MKDTITISKEVLETIISNAFVDGWVEALKAANIRGDWPDITKGVITTERYAAKVAHDIMSDDS